MHRTPDTTDVRPRTRAIAIAVMGLLLAPLIAVVAATPAEAAARPADSTTVLRILRDTNKIRAAHGLGPLYRSTAIDTVARNWSTQQAQANAMTHNPSFSSQIPAGWSRAGENVAYGYDPGASSGGFISVVDAWRKSSGHLANMIGDYTDIGIGIAYSSSTGYPYYTQNFGKYAAAKSASSTAATAVQLDGQTVDSRTGLAMPVNPCPATLPTSASSSSASGNRHDLDGDGRSDVVVWTSTGSLLDYRASGSGGWAGRSTIGSGWTGMTQPSLTPDFDGDGNADLIARRPNGTLWLFRGNGAGGWLGSACIGSGWGSLTQILAVGDFDGDSRPDVMARTSTGDLWLYSGNGTGGWAGKRKIGSGWNGFDALIAPGDFDGDGNVDLIGRTPAGALRLYPGNGSGGWKPARTIGSGWNGFRTVVAAGDFDGDGHSDVLATTSAGALYLYAGTGSGGWKKAKAIGSGWSSLTFVR